MVPGALIAGKYRLVRLLGEGAMGAVWGAVNELTEREVALKLIRPMGEGTEQLRMRLLREARACGRIAHRNVIEVYDVGQTAEGDPFLVMPLLDGESLQQRLAREPRLPEQFAARIGWQVAGGLSAAHAAQIIHRDLKPGNIFLHRDPSVARGGASDALVATILDFGVSKVPMPSDSLATMTGSAIGSPAYMAPEQARGDRDIDHRADLWAFGVVLFEMLAGRRPFPGETAYAVAVEILTGPVPRLDQVVPEADPRFVELAARCLDRDPSRRVGSAGEIAAMLHDVITHPRRLLRSEPTVRIDASSLRIDPEEATALMSGLPVSSEDETAQAAATASTPGAAAEAAFEAIAEVSTPGAAAASASGGGAPASASGGAATFGPSGAGAATSRSDAPATASLPDAPPPAGGAPAWPSESAAGAMNAVLPSLGAGARGAVSAVVHSDPGRPAPPPDSRGPWSHAGGAGAPAGAANGALPASSVTSTSPHVHLWPGLVPPAAGQPGFRGASEPPPRAGPSSRALATKRAELIVASMVGVLVVVLLGIVVLAGRPGTEVAADPGTQKAASGATEGAANAVPGDPTATGDAPPAQGSAGAPQPAGSQAAASAGAPPASSGSASSTEPAGAAGVPAGSGVAPPVSTPYRAPPYGTTTGYVPPGRKPPAAPTGKRKQPSMPIPDNPG